MTLNGYFTSNAVFVPAVLLRGFNFQSPPQKKNEDRRTQSVTKMQANENECSFKKSKRIRFVQIFAGVP